MSNGKIKSRFLTNPYLFSLNLLAVIVVSVPYLYFIPQIIRSCEDWRVPTVLIGFYLPCILLGFLTPTIIMVGSPSMPTIWCCARRCASPFTCAMMKSPIFKSTITHSASAGSFGLSWVENRCHPNMFIGFTACPSLKILYAFSFPGNWINRCATISLALNTNAIAALMQCCASISKRHDI